MVYPELALQHWLLLTSAKSSARHSHWKAAVEIRGWVTALIWAIDDTAAQVGLLDDMARVIRIVARKKRRKRFPSLFQLLEDPELLDWRC